MFKLLILPECVLRKIFHVVYMVDLFQLRRGHTNKLRVPTLLFLWEWARALVEAVSALVLDIKMGRQKLMGFFNSISRVKPEGSAYK